MGSRKPGFTLLDHTADLGIKVFANDLETLFEEAARSMIHVMMEAPAAERTSAMKLQVTGQDLADLMVRWLGEILYLVQAENTVVAEPKVVSVSPVRLDAIINTVSFDPNIHEMIYEIKAVTYHQIEVAQRRGRWEARIIFDV
jgi:SHS2 domain-containing protein